MVEPEVHHLSIGAIELHRTRRTCSHRHRHLDTTSQPNIPLGIDDGWTGARSFGQCLGLGLCRQCRGWSRNLMVCATPRQTRGLSAIRCMPHASPLPLAAGLLGNMFMAQFCGVDAALDRWGIATFGMPLFAHRPPSFLFSFDPPAHTAILYNPATPSGSIFSLTTHSDSHLISPRTSYASS